MHYLESFRSLTSKVCDAYSCAVHSYVGLKTPGGVHLFSGRVLFQRTRPTAIEPPFSFETGSFVAGKFLHEAGPDEISTALARAEFGQMQLAHGVAVLLPNVNSDRFDDYFYPAKMTFPAIYKVSGISRHNLLSAPGRPNSLEWELQTADVPFNGLDELLARCGLPDLKEMGEATTLQIVADRPAVITDRSTISDGVAAIECRTAKVLNPDRLKLGFQFFQGKRRTESGSRTGTGSQWIEDAGENVGKWLVQAGDAAKMDAYLSFDGMPLDSQSIIDPLKQPNPRHAVHSVFDPDGKILEKMLTKPKKDDARVFEIAVSTLFTLLGFTAANYGIAPKLQDGTDVIAYTPLGNVALVECTIDLIDQKDKLAKLVQRSVLISNKLVEAGHDNAQVQPVIVTPCQRAEVAAAFGEAEKHSIAVICREELQDLLARISQPPDAEGTFQFLRQKIPITDPNDLRLLFGRQ